MTWSSHDNNTRTMEEELGQIRKLLGGCLFVLIFIIVGCIFPWALLFLIPYTLHLYSKHCKEKKKIDQLLDNELQGLTLEQVIQRRIEMIQFMQNPYATKEEKDCAKYAIKYIEKNYLKL